MTYSSGSLIQASDYNTFVGNTTAGLNRVWSTGAGDAGWGQPTISTASTGGTVAATQWASLVNNLSSSGSQSNTTVTTRTAPTTGTTIGILANVATNITSITTNRGNAAASGTEYGVFTGNVSKTTATGNLYNAWQINWTHTITFPSADQARYFWNAGGIVRIKYGKSSTGTDCDPDWNTFVGQCGTINITGRVNDTSQTIAGQAYTGTTRLGGTGGTQTTLATTTGWYNLTGVATTMFQLNNATDPYTGEYIFTLASVNVAGTVLTLQSRFLSDGLPFGPGRTGDISGGTATTSPSTTITGTAPTVLVTYIPPSTTYLTNTWGTPAIAASVA